MPEWALVGGQPAAGLLWAGWWAIAAVLSAAMTVALVHWADKLGIIDRPNARSSHQRPTPRGGGIAIVACGLAAVAALLAFGMVPPPGSGWVFLGAVVVAAVSAVDDVASMSPRARLLVHLAAAGLAVFATGPAQILELCSLGRFDFGPAARPLLIIWIVGMTNAFNFMDGTDGIAGTTAVVALGVLASAFSLAGDQFLSLLAAALSAASAGFLVWNWQPARIFMGDVGSAFLGYTIAVLPLLASPESRPWMFPLTGFVMWPFLFDTAYTLVRRVANRENVFEAHRSHLYQRLVIGGWSHAAVAILYGCLSLAAGAAGLSARVQPANGPAADLVAVGTVVVGALGLVALVKMSEARAASVAK